MERSLYLEYYAADKLELPYETDKEAADEQFSMLRILMECALEEQNMKSGSGKPSKAAKKMLDDFIHLEFLRIQGHIRSRGNASAAQGKEPAIFSVYSCLGLNEFESFLLLAAVSENLCPETRELVKKLENDSRRTWISKGLACRLYGILKEAPEKEFLELIDGKGRISLAFKSTSLGTKEQAEPWYRQRMYLHSRIVSAICGYSELSGQLQKVCCCFDPLNQPEPLWIYGGILEKAACVVECNGTEGSWVLYLHGRRGSGKRLLVRHLACRLHTPILCVDGRKLAAADVIQFHDILKEILLESILSGQIVCIADLPEDGRKAQLMEKLAQLHRLVIFTGIEKKLLTEETFSAVASLELPAPNAVQKTRIWGNFMKQYQVDPEVDPELNGSKYILNGGEIKEVLETARLRALGEMRQSISNEDIIHAVRQLDVGQLGEYAVRVPAVFGWDDLIVEKEVRQQLDYICGQLKYRSIVGDQWGFHAKTPYGRGLCALFYGPPGTGKTMAVQVIAKELGLDLYRIDLSQMVSKYIGETEKNITALFRKAKEMNVILFFDEADAFFSRRSEIKDANDRNANAEVAHLLQKLEEYDGITILATNLKENIDDAFKRRIKFMIDFRFPQKKTRRELWRKLLPEQAPREEGLDLNFFADEFELSGSQIKEILLNAAYIAAGDSGQIENRHIKEAVRLNYSKYGKLLTKIDFGYLG